jgi:uncharacterized cupredoxin-like copper-binding protein
MKTQIITFLALTLFGTQVFAGEGHGSNHKGNMHMDRHLGNSKLEDSGQGNASDNVHMNRHHGHSKMENAKSSGKAPQMHMNRHHGHGSHDSHASSVGEPSQRAAANKVIKVEATDDMKFNFSENLDIKEGEVITFVVTNNGDMRHEFSIGSNEEQKAHREMMRKMPNMKHEDGNTITVEAGQTKELTWKFKGNEKVVMACNIPGHFEAGMHAMAKIGMHHH